MQNEKIDILTFADHPLPAYDVRPYRSALFIDAAPRDFGSRIFVIAPEGGGKYSCESAVIRLYSPTWRKFSDIQYSMLTRIGRIISLLLLVARFMLFHRDKLLIRVSNGYLGLIASLVKRRNDFLVLDCCDFYFDLYREFGLPLPGLICPVLFALERHAFRQADLLIVDTPAQCRYMSSIFRIPSNRIFALPNGVLLDKYPLPVAKDTELMSRYGIDVDDIVLFYGGDISALDGIELAAEFLKSKPKEFSQRLHLIIIGKGRPEYMASLKQILKSEIEDGSVIFENFVPYDQYINYLSIADICLAPFRITPTSNNVECGKIITYLLAGKQVVASKGVVEIYGDAVCYTADNNVEEFSKAVQEAFNRSKRSSGKEDQRRVGEQFDFLKMVAVEWELSKAVISGNPVSIDVAARTVFGSSDNLITRLSGTQY